MCVCACVLGRGGSEGSKAQPPPRPRSHTHTPTPGRQSCSLLVGALSPAGPQFGPERTFSGILGLRSRGAERGPRTLLSPGSGRSGFSQPPASLGVRLPLLPREAHRRSKAALGLGPRSVNRTAPAAICSGVGDSDFSTLLPASASRLRGLFPGCTQSGPGDLRDASQASAWRRLRRGRLGLRAAYPEGAASSASEPSARSKSGTLQPSSHSGPAKRSWAGPGWARLIENPGRWGCLSPPGSRTHTLTLRIGGPSRRWCGPSPGDSSAHARDVKARPLFTHHQHQPQALRHSDPHALPSLASHLPTGPPRLASRDPLGREGPRNSLALEFQAWDRRGDKLGPLVPSRPLLVF